MGRLYPPYCHARDAELQQNRARLESEPSTSYFVSGNDRGEHTPPALSHYTHSAYAIYFPVTGVLSAYPTDARVADTGGRES